MTCPSDHIASTQRSRKDRTNIQINVAAHQEKKNENAWEREAEEQKKNKQMTNFRECVCCPSAVVSEGSTGKNVWCGESSGASDLRGGQ